MTRVSQPLPPPVRLMDRQRAGQPAIVQLAWFVFILWIVVCVLFNFAMLGNADSVTKELAGCAKTGVGLLAGYMFCRAVEGIARP